MAFTTFGVPAATPLILQVRLTLRSTFTFTSHTSSRRTSFLGMTFHRAVKSQSRLPTATLNNPPNTHSLPKPHHLPPRNTLTKNSIQSTFTDRGHCTHARCQLWQTKHTKCSTTPQSSRILRPNARGKSFSLSKRPHHLTMPFTSKIGFHTNITSHRSRFMQTAKACL